MGQNVEASPPTSKPKVVSSTLILLSVLASKKLSDFPSLQKPHRMAFNIEWGGGSIE